MDSFPIDSEPLPPQPYTDKEEAESVVPGALLQSAARNDQVTHQRVFLGEKLNMIFLFFFVPEVIKYVHVCMCAYALTMKVGVQALLSECWLAGEGLQLMLTIGRVEIFLGRFLDFSG